MTENKIWNISPTGKTQHWRNIFVVIVTQKGKIHLPFVFPWWFQIVLAMLIIASKWWNDKIMINWMDENNANIKSWVQFLYENVLIDNNKIYKLPIEKNQHWYNIFVVIINNKSKIIHLPLCITWWF